MLPRITSSVTLEPGAPCKQVHARYRPDMSRVGLLVDRADEIAGLEPGALRRRSVPDAEHAQIELTRSRRADVARRQRRLRVDRLHLVGLR